MYFLYHTVLRPSQMINVNMYRYILFVFTVSVWVIFPECRIHAPVNQVNICSDNGLSPIWRQAIISTSAMLLCIGHVGTNFMEISIKIQNFALTKISLRIPSAKGGLFSGGDEIMHWDKDFSVMLPYIVASQPRKDCEDKSVHEEQTFRVATECLWPNNTCAMLISYYGMRWLMLTHYNAESPWNICLFFACHLQRQWYRCHFIYPNVSVVTYASIIFNEIYHISKFSFFLNNCLIRLEWWEKCVSVVISQLGHCDCKIFWCLNWWFCFSNLQFANLNSNLFHAPRNHHNEEHANHVIKQYFE